MKRLLRTPVVIAGLIVNLAATAVFAQSEKISPRIAPKPNQTVHLTMVQEMDMNISFDAVGPAPLAGPMMMTMKSTMSMTQKTGAVKPDGSYDAEIRYDDMQVALMMNGQPLPTGTATNPLVGKVIMVTYNRSGQVIDTRFPSDVGPSAEIVKQLMMSFSGNLPDMAVGVGEAVSIPLDMTLPLPIPGVSELKLDGQTETKLVSIDKDARGRSAKFDSITYGKMMSSLPVGGKNAMNLDFTISGTGTTVMDLDAGFVRTGEANATIDAKVIASPGSSPAGMPPMTMKGSMKVTFTGSN